MPAWIGVTLTLSVFWDVLGTTRPVQSTTACQNSMQMITIILSALWLGRPVRQQTGNPAAQGHEDAAQQRPPAHLTPALQTRSNSSPDIPAVQTGVLSSLFHALSSWCIFLSSCSWVQTQNALSISVYPAAHLFLIGLWGAFQFSLCLCSWHLDKSMIIEWKVFSRQGVCLCLWGLGNNNLSY